MQWVVDGGNYKACFLLPDSPSDVSRDAEEYQPDGTSGLLSSEVCRGKSTHMRRFKLTDLRSLSLGLNPKIMTS